MTGPYTPKSMEAARTGPDALDSRFDGLAAEASAAVGASANTLRSVREQYREAYAEALAGWQSLRDELASSPDDSRNGALRGQAEAMGSELRAERATLEKLEIAERTLARTWLFLERGDGSLVAEASDGLADGDLAMRIVEAQEAERSRLAMEIHDGPAQSLTNAIFQADYIERLCFVDPAVDAAENQIPPPP
jgi:signal transduction histidine kinase